MNHETKRELNKQLRKARQKMETKKITRIKIKLGIVEDRKRNCIVCSSD